MGARDVQPFSRSIRSYERWLTAQLDEVWQQDLREKHRKMCESPFVFLRATYWRWAETILTICDDLKNAPEVIGVGDIHLENYGVWRDREGRLTWGVNDLDEAATMPYAVDVVRLATSAILSRSARRRERRDICLDILEGYRQGLAQPRPFSLDEEHPLLRELFVVPENERRRFWKKMGRLRNDRRIPDRYRSAIEEQMPGVDARIMKFAHRTAGTGSLGRPRWVGVAIWRGGRVVREAKAIVPSAWCLTHRQRSAKRPGALIAAGSHRAPDPWYHVHRHVVVRRLSPNARKIEVQEYPKLLCSGGMLRPMGHDLANVHVGTGDYRRVIERDLDRRREKWLVRAAETACEFIARDFAAWQQQRGN
jgi:uncharacterized protein (DUF2252 family)